ncbi:MAG: DegT/DnrJ/EryC1/StrS family aminotransferase [Haloarculaceae archaeon]
MSDLTIDGGDPVAPDGVETEWPVFGDAEREALLEVLESGNWCSADFYFEGEGEQSHVQRFERAFADFVGTDHATAVPNGTQALELAFRAVGLEPGEEVVVPSVTFVASASAVVQAGGVPVFVDVDPDTYQLDPDAVEAAITGRTAAIEAVHYGGYPADMDRLVEIADDHDLYLIEDAAEAHGTEWRGETVGSIGDVGCFSLQLGKPLTCGEGGVVTHDGDDAELADRLYAHANLGRSPEGGKYEHHVPAGNYRLSEFLGALLCTQLSRLDEQTDRRETNGAWLADRVAAVEGLSTLQSDDRITRRGYYFYFVRYDADAWGGLDRDDFVAALRAEGVDCSTAHNDPLYQHAAFADIDPSLLRGREMDYAAVSCPEAERIYDSEVVALSKDVLLERESVEAVAAAFEKLDSHREALADLV